MPELFRKLTNAVTVNAGEEFPIFIDRDEIGWGQQWRERIERSIDSTTLLIAVVTPAYFKSEWCRREFHAFRERERKLNRQDLIFSIYYVEAPAMENQATHDQDEIATEIKKRQFVDWRALRLESLDSLEVEKQIDKMARAIIASLERSALENEAPPPLLEVEYSSTIPPKTAELADVDAFPSTPLISPNTKTLPTRSSKAIRFNCSAVASGGHIYTPQDVFIKAGAASNIPASGGFSETILSPPAGGGPFNYRDVITFSRAHSRAIGIFERSSDDSETDGSHNASDKVTGRSSVESSIENLHVQIGEPEANSVRRCFTVKSLRVLMEGFAESNSAIAFTGLTVLFEGLQLSIGDSTDTLLVTARTDIFTEFDTGTKLKDKYEQDSGFRRQFGPLFLQPGRKGLVGLIARKESPFSADGYVEGSLVSRLAWVGNRLPAGTQILGNRLTIENFGRIYFGEIAIDQNSRHITLMRFELDSVVEGEASFCDAHLEIVAPKG